VILQKLGFPLSHFPPFSLFTWIPSFGFQLPSIERLAYSGKAMGRLFQWIVPAAVLVGAALRVSAAGSAESQKFDAAHEAFDGTFWERAEAQFAAIAQTFTNSARLPEAILFQAEACYKQGKYAPAIKLLSENLGAAGKLADEYLFWLGEVRFRNGDLVDAAELFARLGREFPASRRRLEASIEEVAVRSQLKQWTQVIGLLERTNGAFQSAVRSNAFNMHVVNGFFWLAKAQLAQSNYVAAEAALEPLSETTLDPATDWRRQALLCRIQSEAGWAEKALRSTTNLLALAARTGQSRPQLQAESFAFQAGLLEGLGRHDEAIAAYVNNLTESTPADLQGEALKQIVHLLLVQGKLGEAAQILEKFLEQSPKAVRADQAWLALGELRLRQYLVSASSNVATGGAVCTNCLEQALSALTTLTSQFPQSSFLGKAQLVLGWCYWNWPGGRWPQSQAAFVEAARLLPRSAEQATAYFKLADAQFHLTNYPAAIANYAIVITNLADLDEVKTNLLELALYQTVLAGQAGSNFAVATNALSKILAWFPDGFHAARALLVTGQEIGREAPAVARKMFEDFLHNAPAEPLRPELELAIARTYEEENRWPEAIAGYDRWVTTFTNHQAQADACYYRARANFRASRETNAFALYTDFVARFPTNALVPLANWWIAMYYYSSGKYVEAEQSFKTNFFQNTNMTPSRLTYEAQLMAGRSAFRRDGWNDAKNHFSKLASDTNCPPDLRAQAFFAYGDTLISQDSTNKPEDYQEAANAFDYICVHYTNSSQAMLAWGKKGECYLQMGQYDLATRAFQIVTNTLLTTNVAARCSAMAGLALVLKKQAEDPEKTSAEQTTLLKQALDRYLDIFYPENMLLPGEKPDPFWIKQAGLEAASLAETLHQWPQAIAIYQRLQEWLPPLRSKLEKNIQKCREQSERVHSQEVSAQQ
jgi:tetratricopeptide (TPR) repeat protein